MYWNCNIIGVLMVDSISWLLPILLTLTRDCAIWKRASFEGKRAVMELLCPLRS